MLTLRRPQSPFPRPTCVPAPVLAAVWAVAAVAGGLGVARLPLFTTVEILAGLLVVAAAVWEPAIGLGLALAVGVTRAYVAAARPDIPDLGQVLLGLALAGWAARCLAQRRIIIPRSGLLVVLGVYVGASVLSLLPTLSASLELGLKEIIKWAELGAILVLVASEAERGRLRWIITAILLT